MTYRAWKSLMRGLNALLGAICGSILVLMLVLTSVNVLMRYGFNAPIAWADQFTAYGLVYLTFIGAPYALSKGAHVSLDLFSGMLHSGNKDRLNFAVNIVGILYCCLLGFLAFRELSRVIERETLVLDAIVIPEWIIVWVIPFSFTLLVLQFLDNLLTTREQDVPHSAEDRSA